jgi:hypothetical protein
VFFSARWNFLLLLYEIQSTGKMTEGTVPVPAYHPCAYSDDDVLPVQEVSHFGGSRSGGGETPVVGSSFFDRFL